MPAFHRGMSDTRSQARSGCSLLWHTESGGLLAADTPGLRLVVQAGPGRDRTARFIILRRLEGSVGPAAMIASGSKESVRDAMLAAEQVAARTECA